MKNLVLWEDMIVKNPIIALFRARDKSGKQQSVQNAVSAATTFSFGGSSAGKSVTPRNAIQVSVVYACVRVIAETMLDAHYIEWILLETKEGRQRKTLKPGEKPVATFALTDGDAVVAAYEYCNLHGLWKSN